jgi:uncharacterized Fe-S center protein
MAAEVFFSEPGEQTAPVAAAVARLADALGLAAASSAETDWGLKVQLGLQGRAAAINPGWAGALAETLAPVDRGGALRKIRCFDTLSITTAGLEETTAHLTVARAKGFDLPQTGLDYQVADDPELGSSLMIPVPGGRHLAEVALAAGIGGYTGVLVLAPVRPHPHLGFRGSVATLGGEFVDRGEKLRLHQDIRPQVNTPLCAGCGSCLAVCLFDAIRITGGRAFIDHQKCTGCGECMNVCYMAGIAPEQIAGVVIHQEKLAEAARAVGVFLHGRVAERLAFFNFLVRRDRPTPIGAGRPRQHLGDVGVLASRDPVALDKATWDLISERQAGGLGGWSGFAQDPRNLLQKAEQLGLGQAAYRLTRL